MISIRRLQDSCFTFRRLQLPSKSKPSDVWWKQLLKWGKWRLGGGEAHSSTACFCFCHSLDCLVHPAS